MAGQPVPARLGFHPSVSWDAQVSHYFQGAFGAAKFEAIAAALCTPPPSTCLRVNTLRTSAQEVLEKVTEKLTRTAPDGSDEQRQPMPYVHPQVPAVILPGKGPLDVDYALAKGKEIVISRKAGEAVLRGAPIYIPGVLACSAGIEAGDLVAVSVVLEKPGSQSAGITRGTIVGSDAWQRAAVPDRSGLYIGLGRCQVGRTELFRLESGTAVVMEQPVFRVPSCEGLEGCVMLQNLPSVVAAMTLQPAPGSRVLDMCAAPGGKTTMLAQLMGDKGEVVALDRSHAKVAEIMSLASELGMTCIKAYKMDATKAVLKPRGLQQQQHEGQEGDDAGQEGGSRAKQPKHEQSGQASGQSEAGRSEEQAADQAVACQGQRQAPQQQPAQEITTALDGLQGQAGQGLAPDGQEQHGGGEGEAGSAKVLKRQRRKAAAMAARGLQPKLAAADGAESSPCGFTPESFDHVLVDAPCSALGLRPRLLQTATLTYLHQCAFYQRKILDAGVALVRPGGTLVFSTCTFNPGENEANVRYILDTHPVMRLVAQPVRVGGPGLVGEHPGPPHLLATKSSKQESALDTGASGQSTDAGTAGGQAQERWLTEEEASLVQRFDPTGETIAFFVAKFEKARPQEGP